MFTTDHKTDHYLLNIMRVEPQYREDVKYHELADNWSVQNFGRPDGQARVNGAVETYANMMVEGSAAPAVIVRKTSAGYDVLDGTQRLLANQETGSTSFAAYIIKCGDATALKIRRAANLRLNTAAPVDVQWVLKELIDEFMIRGSDSPRDLSEVTGRRVSEIDKLYRRRLASSWVTAACHNEQGSDGPPIKEAVLDKIADKAESEDFSGPQAAVVVKFLNQLSACNFRNGDAIHHVDKFFSIKRVGSKNRSTQFRTKHRQFSDDPIVSSRLTGGKKQTGVEAIDTKIKALLTVCKNYKKSQVADLDNKSLVKKWDDNLAEAERILRECCSTAVRNSIDPFSNS